MARGRVAGRSLGCTVARVGTNADDAQRQSAPHQQAPHQTGLPSAPIGTYPSAAAAACNFAHAAPPAAVQRLEGLRAELNADYARVCATLGERPMPLVNGRLVVAGALAGQLASGACSAGGAGWWCAAPPTSWRQPLLAAEPAARAPLPAGAAAVAPDGCLFGSVWGRQAVPPISPSQLSLGLEASAWGQFASQQCDACGHLLHLGTRTATPPPTYGASRGGGLLLFGGHAAAGKLAATPQIPGWPPGRPFLHYAL